MLVVVILQSVSDQMFFIVLQAGKFNIIPTVIAIGSGLAIMGMVSNLIYVCIHLFPIDILVPQNILLCDSMSCSMARLDVIKLF